jgi:predicted phage baseplate assembly protein
VLLNRLDERIIVNRRPAIPTDRTLLTTLQVAPNRSGASAASEVASRLLVAAQPGLRDVFYQALQNQPPSRPLPQVEVYAFRVQSGLFGANAVSDIKVTQVNGDQTITRTPWDYSAADKFTKTVWLDSPQPQIFPQDYIALVDTSGSAPRVFPVQTVAVVSRADYGLSARTTRIDLATDWFTLPAQPVHDDLARLRTTTVFAQPEKLTLAEEPIPDNDNNAVGLDLTDTDHLRHADLIELQDIVPDLDAGRLVVFSGERADLPGVSGIPGSELARLAAVELLEPGASDSYQRPVPRRISVLHLDSPLTYTYRRGSLKIYGNVALATNGESRDEVLGGGDASEAWSSYTLRQFPVTRLPAPTPQGSASTLRVRVHGVLWHEVDRLIDAGSTDHVYQTTTGDDGRTTVIFGDGAHGARPATDVENVRATLRVGLGQGGNVRVGQVSLLTRPPAGVLTVTNPLAGSGGAGPEGRDRARRNAPLGTLTLDRLVSVIDYAAFARTFAGIGKAEAAELADGRRHFVHLTVAGSDDLPLAPGSDLLLNLAQALARAGDPREPVQIDPRERVLLVLQAGVRIDPDYQWADIDAALRQALVQKFPFEDRGMGRDMFLSEVIATLQGVAGVLEVEVDIFDGVSERRPGTYIDNTGQKAQGRVLLIPKDLGDAVVGAVNRATRSGPHDRVCVRLAAVEGGTVRPAQIAYFGPETLDVLKGAVTFRRID